MRLCRRRQAPVYIQSTSLFYQRYSEQTAGMGRYSFFHENINLSVLVLSGFNYYCHLSLCLINSQIFPVRTPSSWTPFLWHILIILWAHLAFWHHKTLVLYLSCPSSRNGHFSEWPWFLVAENGFRNPVLDAKCARCYCLYFQALLADRIGTYHTYAHLYLYLNFCTFLSVHQKSWDYTDISSSIS